MTIIHEEYPKASSKQIKNMPGAKKPIKAAQPITSGCTFMPIIIPITQHRQDIRNQINSLFFNPNPDGLFEKNLLEGDFFPILFLTFR